MKQIYFLLLMLLVQQASAQTTVKGRVVDTKSRPLRGVNVAIRDSYDGATSDSSGRFSFITTETGQQWIDVQHQGYLKLEQMITLSGKEIEILLQLKEEVTELTAVTISAGTFEASDRKRSAAFLEPLDIVTTASANGDITGALKTLPGAQQVGESEGLFVRGGTAAETKTYIDGTLINNFFFSTVPNIAQFSRFSPFIFKGTVFSTGGYSALYGQALSSALILESIDLPERSSASLGVSVIGVNGGFQQLAKNNKASYGVSYSYTNLAPAFAIIKQKQDYSTAPAYHNADANFRIKTSATGMLKYYGYFSTNKLDFTANSIDTPGYYDRFKILNDYHYHNLSWRENINPRWKLQLGVSYANNKDDIFSNLRDAQKEDVLVTGMEARNFTVNSRGNYWNSRLVLEHRLRGLSAIRFGSEINYSKENSVYRNYLNQDFTGEMKETVWAGFAEADIYLTNKLAAKAGARVEHSSIIDQSNIAPRLSLAYKLGKHGQASLAYGLFYQNPERKYLPSPTVLKFMRAEHYIAQYMRSVNNKTFRLELFYKKYDDLIKTDWVNFRETAISNDGYGKAKGIELFWRDKKSVPTLDYWISYSYLDTKRDFLNFPLSMQPNFAAKHTSSLVVKKFVQKWKTNLNTAYNFASGRPYYNILRNGNNEFEFSDRGRTAAYHNVSFSINYLPFIGKQNPKTYTVWVLQVSNIFNFKQTYGYQYSMNGQRRQEINPPSRTFVFIGCFINFGIDRSDEIMNRL